MISRPPSVRKYFNTNLPCLLSTLNLYPEGPPGFDRTTGVSRGTQSCSIIGGIWIDFILRSRLSIISDSDMLVLSSTKEIRKEKCL
jgi:hypothetical protein